MRNGKKELSVCLACSYPITLDYPLEECILSINPIADEIIIINGDHYPRKEMEMVIDKLAINADELGDKIKMYDLPWNDAMRINMFTIANSAGMAQCTKDYVLWLDADEVIHEDDYEKIYKCMELGMDAYSFRTIHFYRDYNHFKIPKGIWYNHRPKLFKNGLGIWDGYQSWIDGIGKLKCDYTSDLITWDYKPVHSFSKKTTISIYHYGWVMSDKVVLEKKNRTETRFHPDWVPLTKWEWNMSDTEEFKGTHPAVMKDRIERFNYETIR